MLSSVPQIAPWKYLYCIQNSGGVLTNEKGTETHQLRNLLAMCCLYLSSLNDGVFTQQPGVRALKHSNCVVVFLPGIHSVFCSVVLHCRVRKKSPLYSPAIWLTHTACLWHDLCTVAAELSSCVSPLRCRAHLNYETESEVALWNEVVRSFRGHSQKKVMGGNGRYASI